jgi:uncharacterized RDD family membrane protein YckC
VIPFESISQAPKPPGLRRRPAPAPRREPRRAAQKGPPPGQQQLDFLAPAPPPTGIPAPVAQTSLYCKDEVARIGERARAAAYDALVVAAAYGVFLAVFLGALRLLGGAVVRSRTTLIVGVAIPLLILLFYKLVACIGGIETPGIQWAGLELLHFDGRSPERRQRLIRLFAGFLIAGSAGIGLFWALGDAERLAWQDHISSTFLTKRKPR